MARPASLQHIFALISSHLRRIPLDREEEEDYDPINTRPRSYRLELDFRRALQRVPVRQRAGLRAWIRRYRRHCRHDAHAARTFHELDPATGHWRRL